MNGSISKLPMSSALRVTTLSNEGPPLLVVHGVTRCWQTFLPVLTSLQTRWSVFGVDQRGHAIDSGEVLSEAAPDYRVTAYVSDLVQHIKDHFDVPVAIWGHSLGAMVALGAAGALRERVAGVILEDPPLNTMGRRMDRNRLYSYFKGLRELLAEALCLPDLMQRMKKLEYIDPDTGSSTRLEQVRDQAGIHFSAWCASRIDPRVLDPIVALQWLDEFDWEEAASRSSATMLVCQADPQAGGMLTDSDSDRLMELLAKRDVQVPSCHLRWTGTGHTIHDAKPAEIGAKALNFLETIRTSNI